jgi:lysophospholipase L1-like esterase
LARKNNRKEKEFVVLLASLLAIGLGGCGAFDRATTRWHHDSTVNPTARREEWWQDKHNHNVAVARQSGAQAQLIFVGDSITELMENSKDSMNKHFGALKPEQLGISGDGTEHVLWRLQNGEVEGLNPKVAVLLIGTNNLNDADDQQVFEGVEKVVKELQARLPKTKILVLGLLPRGDKPDHVYRKRVAEVNALLQQKIADNKQVFYGDVGQVFLLPGGMMNVPLMPDYLHPSPAGYDAMFAAMKPTVDHLASTP